MKIPPKIQIGITGLFAAVILFIATGCHSDDDTPKTKAAEGAYLSFWAAYMNDSQTNWTVTITARTNQLRKPSAN